MYENIAVFGAVWVSCGILSTGCAFALEALQVKGCTSRGMFRYARTDAIILGIVAPSILIVGPLAFLSGAGWLWPTYENWYQRQFRYLLERSRST